MGITKEQFANLEIGDTIEFKSPTRYTARKATRKITGFPKTYESNETWGDRSSEYVKVRYEGSPCFYVRAYEIIRVL